MRPLDQVFSHRIQPDVPGDGFNGFQCAKNMVVKFVLPQDASRLSSVLSATFNFENLYSVEQVTGGFDALRQEMERIGHKAVGVHMERSMQQIVTK